MNPIKRNKISELTAKETGHSVALVDAVASFYWKVIREKLSSAKYITVAVDNLGSFSVMGKALDRKIEKTTGIIDNLDTRSSMQSYAVRMERREDLARFNELKRKIEDENQRKQEVKDKKQRYESDKTVEE